LTFNTIYSTLFKRGQKLGGDPGIGVIMEIIIAAAIAALPGLFGVLLKYAKYRDDRKKEKPP
jgi:hypothetical protein